MPRSLRVRPDCINHVKLAISRNGFPSQRSLAEDAGFALATVSNFLTGKPVDYKTFEELCRKLGLNWRDISTVDVEIAMPQLDEEIELTERIFPVANVAIVLPFSTRGCANGTLRIGAASPQAEQTGCANDQDLDTSPSYPNGAVPLGSPFYLERIPFEAQIDREIRKPGALIRIKAPREMGKTSLLLRILDTAKNLGYHTVSLNIEQVDVATLSDLHRFLRWLCANVARQLQLQPKLDEYWDEDLGGKISCTAYFQDYLLAAINTPLILALDEVNQIFEHPHIAKDFFPLLRSWYEQAKTLPIWQKFRSIVVHSTEIYIPLQLNQSPFNVGLPIQLTTFSLAEVQQLAQHYGIDWEDESQARQLMELVGGHPALINIAFYHLQRGDLTLPQLLKTAPTATGIYNHHLQRHWATLAEQPELARALDRVMSAEIPVTLAPIIAYKLNSLGLIERSGDKAIPGCKLYQRAFKSVQSD
jgi:DNA-binding Xre family transcriptional regulator